MKALAVIAGILVATSALAACRSNKDSGAARTSPPSTPSASSSATGVDARAAEAPLVDLLYQTRVEVKVSSNVLNPRDYPEHLLDRRRETAWNGKTGDLAAWIALKVPPAARLRKITLVVGFDKIGAEGDLFTMNHRIKKVALEREGKPVGTYDLDPEKRDPQAITLDEAGGDFKLRVVETVPGSKKEWKEIVISELAVLGTAPESELLAPAMPQVNVEGLHRATYEGKASAATRKASPYPSLEAMCEKFMSVAGPAVEQAKKTDDSPWASEASARCSPQPRKESSDPKRQRAPLPIIAVIATSEGLGSNDYLALKGAKGWYLTRHSTDSTGGGPGCGMREAQLLESTEVTEAGVAILHETARLATWGGPFEPIDQATRTFVACTVGDDEPACREELVAHYTDPTGIEHVNGPWKVPPLSWDWTRDATVDDRGAIRLGPCVTSPAREVACRGSSTIRPRR